MKLSEFLMLRGGFTPRSLGLPDSVLEGAASNRLSISERFHQPRRLANGRTRNAAPQANPRLDERMEEAPKGLRPEDAFRRRVVP